MTVTVPMLMEIELPHMPDVHNCMFRGALPLTMDTTRIRMPIRLMEARDQPECEPGRGLENVRPANK